MNENSESSILEDDINDDNDISDDSLNSQKASKTVIVFGAKEVGKTSLLIMLRRNKFLTKYITTIAVDLCWKEFETINLFMWDTNGDELKINYLQQHLYKTASAFVIMSSYDNLESLMETRNYIDLIKRQQEKQRIPVNERQPIISLINKADIPDKKFTINQASNILKEHFPPILIGDISCKSSQNVQRFFNKLVDLITNNQSSVIRVENGNNSAMEYKRGSNLFFSGTFKINDSPNVSKISNSSSQNNKKKCC